MEPLTSYLHLQSSIGLEIPGAGAVLDFSAEGIEHEVTPTAYGAMATIFFAAVCVYDIVL